MTKLTQTSIILNRIGLESVLFLGRCGQRGGTGTGMSEKPGRDLRKELLLELNHSA